MLEALSELEDCFCFSHLTGAQGLALATETEVSGALVTGEAPMDLDVPVRGLSQDSLSLCPDSGTEDSDVEDGASHRRFSHLLSETMSTGGPLLARVQRGQKHQTPAKACSSEVEADGPGKSCTEEQGPVFKQNVAVMRDMLREDMAPPSLDVVPRVEPLSALLRAELSRVEVPFLPYVAQRLTELSAALRGEVDGHESGHSGDSGLQKGKLMPKPKARMDVYRVSCNVFSFVASSLRRMTHSACLCRPYRDLSRTHE